MLLVGTSVDKIFVGGPAYNSQQIAPGDVILKVDGDSVQNENIIDVLARNSAPGSSVMISLAKGGLDVSSPLPQSPTSYVVTTSFLQGTVINVLLTRMANSDFQDRQRMFDLFQTIKVGPCHACICYVNFESQTT
jgi:hypothetical protein